MIGIIKDEDCVILEFNPIFASKKHKWQRVKIPYRCNNFGEYGIAISFYRFKPTFWVNWGDSCYPSIYWFLKDIFKDEIRYWKNLK